MEHARLAAPQPQQPTRLLQAGESHAEITGDGNSSALGKDSHLRVHIFQ